MTQAAEKGDRSVSLPDQDRIEELAAYYDRTDTGDPEQWQEADDAVIERPALEQISIRLPREDVTELKRRAGQVGIGYTTLMRVIVREYLRRPRGEARG